MTRSVTSVSVGAAAALPNLWLAEKRGWGRGEGVRQRGAVCMVG